MKNLWEPSMLDDLPEEYMSKFIFASGYYIPKDRSDNRYRHFGTVRDGALYLSPNELRYLFSSEPPAGCSLETEAYFELKNSDANILAGGDGKHRIYNKTKHFNRNKDSPLGLFEFRERDDEFVVIEEKTVVGVKGEDTVCFLRLMPLDKLDSSLNVNLYK